MVKLIHSDVVSVIGTSLKKNILERRKSIMKKLIALVLAVLMLCTVLAACGESGGGNTNSGDNPSGGNTTVDDPFYGEDDIKLTVWAADKAQDLTKSLCDEFKALYPDKKITIEVLVQGEDTAATSLMSDKDAAADVFSFACDQLERLCKSNALAPVFDTEDIEARNVESSVNAAKYDGTLYAFPETGDNGYYLVYDKTVVSDEDAKTLEGVLEACRKAGRKFVIPAGDGFFACMFAFTGGLSINGVVDDVQQFNDYDEDEVVNTLAAFANLFHEYSDVFVSGEATRINSGFAENPRTVGGGVDGPWDADACIKALGDDLGATKLPTINVEGTDKQIISMHGFKFIGVNAKSKFPNASQLLADFLTNEESQVKRAEAVSWGPSNKNAATNAAISANPCLVAISAQAEYSIPQLGIANTFWTPMGTLGDALWKEGLEYDKATLKATFEDCIKRIKDE